MPQILAMLPEPGGYFMVAKVVAVLILTIPWLYVAPWVSHDAKRVRAPREMWSLVVLCAGVLGVMLWLLLPVFMLGMVAYLLLTVAGLLAYVVYRNGRVADDQKVLTGAHLSSLFSRQKREEQPDLIIRLKLYDRGGKVVRPPDPQEAGRQDVEAWNATQELLYDALWRRASETDLLPGTEGMQVRMVIDGVVTRRPDMYLTMGDQVIQFLKGHAGLDTEDRRKPQQGSVSVDVANRRADIQVTTTGTTTGQRMQLRVLQEAIRQRLDDLGMAPEALERVRKMTSSSGLLLVSGPPKSGVTSTLYSLLRQQDAFQKNIVAVEAKHEVDLENITQVPYAAGGVAETLASVLRRDPDVVLVDTCPDQPTAEQITEAAEQKLLMLGIGATDSFSALGKWVRVRGNAMAAVENLRGVLCQVIMRKLCVKCREPYRPDPQLLAKANLPADRIDKFYRPPTAPQTDEKGRPIICEACQGTGYHGRTAAFELLEITGDIRELVKSGATLRDIKAACRKARMLYLQEQALRKVIAGETSIQEVLRVTQQAEQKAKKA